MVNIAFVTRLAARGPFRAVPMASGGPGHAMGKGRYTLSARLFVEAMHEFSMFTCHTGMQYRKWPLLGRGSTRRPETLSSPWGIRLQRHTANFGSVAVPEVRFFRDFSIFLLWAI